MPTIRDVAKAAGVSVATVSAVLNDKDKEVSAKVKARVKRVMNELDYKPNRIAQALSRRQTRTIGYLVPSITNPFFPGLAKTVETLASSKDYGVYLCNTDFCRDRVKYYMMSLVESQVAGIIITLTSHIIESNFIETVQKENIPIVGLVGARVVDTIDTVTIDDFGGGRLATQHLIQSGHSNIGFIGSPSNSTTATLRMNGYIKALEDAGLEVKKENIQFSNIELGSIFADETQKQGYTLTQRLMKSNPNITAIFAVNDIIAPGIIEALQEMGKPVPDEVSVIGFDDSIANYTYPKLTTMRIPSSNMATLAVNMLFDRIQGNTEPPRHIRIVPELIRRNSTR